MGWTWTCDHLKMLFAWFEQLLKLDSEEIVDTVLCHPILQSVFSDASLSEGEIKPAHDQAARHISSGFRNHSDAARGWNHFILRILLIRDLNLVEIFGSNSEGK